MKEGKLWFERKMRGIDVVTTSLLSFGHNIEGCCDVIFEWLQCDSTPTHDAGQKMLKTYLQCKVTIQPAFLYQSVWALIQCSISPYSTVSDPSFHVCHQGVMSQCF